MSVSVTFNGTTYVLPTTGETDWGTVLSNYLTDIANNSVTKNGVQTLSNKSFSSNVAVTGGLSVTGTVTGAGFATIPGAGSFKNAVINGGMDVWQRGVSLTPSPGTATYLADRWKTSFDGSGGSTTVAKTAVTFQSLQDLGLTSSMSYNVATTTTSGTFRQLQQQIESVRTFAGRQVTYSFWAWVTTGTISATSFLVQNFGTGGSPSTGVNSSANASTVTTTPTKFSYQVALGSINGKSLGTNGNDMLMFNMNLPTASTYQLFLTGVQIELGAGTSDFAYRPYIQEFMLCQRYYQTGAVWFSTYQAAGTNFGQEVVFPVAMFAAPTLALSAQNYTNASNATTSNPSNFGFISYAPATATGAAFFAANYTATSEIQ
jgi:hypothetical protein